MRLTIFDLDGTLLTGDTDEYWLRFLIDQRIVDRGSIAAQSVDIQRRYAEGRASAEEFCFFYLGLLKGRTRDELAPIYARFFDSIIVPNLPARAFELVAMERAQSDLLVMSTATNAFLSEPIGAHFGFEHIVASDPEVDGDGRFTGGCVGLPNMRAHKVPRLDAWLAQRDLELADFVESRFYSDSRNDLPLLRAVTHPIVVDPDPELEAHARREDWPILHIHPRAPPVTDGATLVARIAD